MNDRELLEFAAKAFGYKVVFNMVGACQLWTDDVNSAYLKFWNPLNDDGDAFRLSICLNMCVTSFTDGKTVGYVIKSIGHEVNEEHDGDQYSATRRAIVRAAAEIGKSINNTKD